MQKVEVKVQTEDRMAAITNLAKAIYECSRALSAVPVVKIEHCTFNKCGTAVDIDTENEVDDTYVLDLDE